MSFLDNILGAVTQPLTQTGQGIAALGQSMRPDRPSPRREKPGYRPAEEAQLDLLAKYATMGASPELVMSLAGEVTGGLDQRLEAWRQKNAMRREAMANLPAMAGQAFEMSQAGMPSDAIGAAFGGVPGKAGNILENQIIGSFPDTTTMGLADEDRAQLDQDTMALVEQGTNLHDARRILVGPMHTNGSTPQEIEDAYNRVGLLYESMAPEKGSMGERVAMLNAPSTYAEYQAQMANEEAAQPKPPASDSSMSTFDPGSSFLSDATARPITGPFVMGNPMLPNVAYWWQKLVGGEAPPAPQARGPMAAHDELMRNIQSGFGTR